MADDDRDWAHPRGGPTDQYQLALNIRYRFIDRWGEDTLKLGFTSVPNALLRINRFVPANKKLGSSEIFVLMTLLSYWWDSHRMPFPSMSRISFETGLSVRQTKRVIRLLAEKEYIEIRKIPSIKIIHANQYDLSRLITIIQRISKHEIEKGKANPSSQYFTRLDRFDLYKTEDDDMPF